jgi:ribosomal protein L16 Arg81 hydroxylase
MVLPLLFIFILPCVLALLAIAIDAEQPDYNKYPLYQKATVIECDVLPGEIIFMPVGWWHHVRSLDICISMSFTNLVFPNYFNYA